MINLQNIKQNNLLLVYILAYRIAETTFNKYIQI